MGMDSSFTFRNHTMDCVAQFPLIKEDPRSGSGEHTHKEQDMCHPEHPSYTPSAEDSRDVPPASPSCSHVWGFQQSRHVVRHSSDRSGCSQDSSWGEIHADQGAPRVSCSFCSNMLRKSTLLLNSPLHRSLRGSKREQMLAPITSPGGIPGLESQPDSSARAWCIFVQGHLGEGGGELMMSEASAADSGCKREGDLLEGPS